jgi:hypothetical protein
MRKTREPHPSEATQDPGEDPSTNPNFEVDITEDIAENQIIITITKFFSYLKLNCFGLMPVVILYPPQNLALYKFCFKKLKAKNIIFPEFYITNFNCKLLLELKIIVFNS